MRLGLRLLFPVFAILGLAAFFVLNVFVHEVKPSVAEVMEDMMVDTAHLLAELASHDMAAGTLTTGEFARAVHAYDSRNPNAHIRGQTKQSVDYRVYVTDLRGIVLFDSQNSAVGQDFSQWRDVHLTLRGEYGARTTTGPDTGAGMAAFPTFFVAAPIRHQGPMLGVLVVAKSGATVAPFIDRAQRKIVRDGAWLVGLSLLVGVAATLWIVQAVRRLARYADGVHAGQRLPVPQLPGELGKLATSMDAMRERLQGQRYIENTVRALTHELKSPLAAIRGAGELLREPLDEADRRRFAGHVVTQSERMQSTVERLLELSKLEQLAAPPAPAPIALGELLAQAVAHTHTSATSVGVQVEIDATDIVAVCDAESVQLALDNLVHNAIAFSPPQGLVRLKASQDARHVHIDVCDEGPGFPDFVKDRLGERFVSTARPSGKPKGSGLGLALASQVAQLHGGALCVLRHQPTTVRLTLAKPAT